jgi:hypothetical protein
VGICGRVGRLVVVPLRYGAGRELTPEQRTLLLEIRREHPTASVPLILRTLADGRLAARVGS